MRKAILILGLVAVTLAAAANDVFAQRPRGGGDRRGGVSISVGSGYYGSPYSYGRGGYYPRYYGYDYGPTYYPAPIYYADPVLPAAEIRQSFYADPNTSTLTVLLPNADAQVWFDDAATTQRGMERTFHTPALQQVGTYTIKARWTDNGRTIDQQRRVQVQPGQAVVVDFRANP